VVVECQWNAMIAHRVPLWVFVNHAFDHALSMLKLVVVHAEQHLPGFGVAVCAGKVVIEESEDAV
jgi:hypothetical protein